MQLSDQLHYDCMSVSALKYYQYYNGYLIVQNGN